MMKNFALVSGNVVAEIIPETIELDGKVISLSQRYHPDFVAALVPVPNDATVAQGDTYADGEFHPRPAAVALDGAADQGDAQRDSLLA